ncbi:N-glycosylase/DNA lyase OGG1 [Phoenix dactylifera]|uniref:DNA-(apurinic or apyrimidinic site) lyase n=1 Tax=Phoenix dactylifera TaxID=42345 RepID=A0A8B9ASK4_PHODC|nr:N-glycosylase/DNA lyase OGG1 [Phoenix dactylifera]
MTKRRRLKPPPPLAASTPPSPPPPLATPPKQNPSPNPNPKPAASRTKTQRSLAPSLLHSNATSAGWEPLHISRSELSLPLSLPTGQTFRWRRTAADCFTGVVGPHLLSLKHLEGDPAGHVAFLLHGPSSASAAALSALGDYLNLGVSLADLWQGFAQADPRFAELAQRFGGGARVLRQDPVECVFQFLCSSNNNIGRIERMVGMLSSFGEYLGTVGGFDFHEFPSLDRLSLVSEQELREAGFGYRAKYVVGTVKALQAKPGGGAEWLASLRGLELHEVVDALCTLPGVGPKVAACIALFSLDQHHAVPVDTHVWQIAVQYLMPELAGMSLTPKLCNRVAEAFVARFGKYAGWAQNVLFIGELSSQKALGASDVTVSSQPKSAKRKRKKNKVAREVSSQGG